MGLLTAAVAAAAVALTGVGATATPPSATLVSTIPASALTLWTQSVLSGKSFVSAETVRAFLSLCCACVALNFYSRSAFDVLSPPIHNACAIVK